MNKYTITDICSLVGGRLIQAVETETQIRELAFDSRRVQQDENTLFFALVTAKNDGHRYIADLYQKQGRQ